MNLIAWATKWQIPIAALQDLKVGMGIAGLHGSEMNTEAGASKLCRLEAAKVGVVLWRNNVGATKDEAGNFFRYGLANDTAAMNKRIKSSDLCGIGPDGLFYAREVKKPGWVFKGTDHENAQLKFIQLVLSKGGNAAFTTGEFKQ